MQNISTANEDAKPGCISSHMADAYEHRPLSEQRPIQAAERPFLVCTHCQKLTRSSVLGKHEPVCSTRQCGPSQQLTAGIWRLRQGCISLRPLHVLGQAAPQKRLHPRGTAGVAVTTCQCVGDSMRLCSQCCWKSSQQDMWLLLALQRGQREHLSC